MQDEKSWANSIWQKVENKMETVVSRTNILFPYTTDEKGNWMESDRNGKHSWWTNGFYPGILWRMYQRTGNKMYEEKARIIEDALDEPLYAYDGLHHDVGFMWLLSSVADYKITGNERSRQRGLTAAAMLASRFNLAGGYLRAWNGDDNKGWTIIDSMMNIPLLYWASSVVGDERFSMIARCHADTVAKHFIREDGSVNHIVCFDPLTGEQQCTLAGQGYEVGSSWTRGQAWAIYGFALSAAWTSNKEYLSLAKRVAFYFMANMKERVLPPCDFRSPEEPVYFDASAALIAASGCLEIASLEDGVEKRLFQGFAYDLLKGVVDHACVWDMDKDNLVEKSTGSYEKDQNIPLIYADYYFLENLARITEGPAFSNYCR